MKAGIIALLWSRELLLAKEDLTGQAQTASVLAEHAR